MSKINWHSIKTIALWAALFIIGGLQALKGYGVGDFTAIIAILGFIEHGLNGNS